MAAIFGETKMFGKLRWLLCRDTLWVKNFVEITLSSTVLRDISISVFCNFAKNSKIQNGRHFLKIGIATLQRNPVGQIFVEIALSSTVFEI